MKVLRTVAVVYMPIYVRKWVTVPSWKPGDAVWVPWGYQGYRPGIVVGFTPKRVQVRLTDGRWPAEHRLTTPAPQSLRRRVE
jgi:primosomal protein N'